MPKNHLASEQLSSARVSYQVSIDMDFSASLQCDFPNNILCVSIGSCPFHVYVYFPMNALYNSNVYTPGLPIGEFYTCYAVLFFPQFNDFSVPTKWFSKIYFLPAPENE